MNTTFSLIQTEAFAKNSVRYSDLYFAARKDAEVPDGTFWNSFDLMIWVKNQYSFSNGYKEECIWVGSEVWALAHIRATVAIHNAMDYLKVTLEMVHRQECSVRVAYKAKRELVNLLADFEW